MKCKARIFLTAAAAVALMAGGCKTTEANYRSAYEKALEKRNEGLSADEIAAFAREEAIPRTVFRGDSIPLRGAYVKCVDGGVGGQVLPYSVAVATFRQKFNAESVFKRLQAAGFSRAALLIDKDEHYLVVATTDSTLENCCRRASESGILFARADASPFPLYSAPSVGRGAIVVRRKFI